MMTIVARELNKIRNNAITSFARGVAMLLTTTIIISLAVLQFEVLCLFNIESATADCIDLTEKATQSYIIHMRRVKLLLYVIFFKSSILLMAVSRLRFVNCNILEVDLLENCAIDVPFMASFIIAYFFYYAPLMIG